MKSQVEKFLTSVAAEKVAFNENLIGRIRNKVIIDMFESAFMS